MVSKIHNNQADLIDAGGLSLAKNIPLEQVFAVLSNSPGFKRISKIKDDASMTTELQKHGLASSAAIEDGKVYQKLKDDHGHEEKKEITCFKDKEG